MWKSTGWVLLRVSTVEKGLIFADLPFLMADFVLTPQAVSKAFQPPKSSIGGGGGFGATEGDREVVFGSWKVDTESRPCFLSSTYASLDAAFAKIFSGMQPCICCIIKEDLKSVTSFPFFGGEILHKV